MVRTGSITSSGAHGYLAAPVQHGGEPPAELEVPAPFGPNWPGPAVAAKAEYGSRCPAGRSAGPGTKAAPYGCYLRKPIQSSG